MDKILETCVRETDKAKSCLLASSEHLDVGPPGQAAKTYAMEVVGNKL